MITVARPSDKIPPRDKENKTATVIRPHKKIKRILLMKKKYGIYYRKRHEIIFR